MCFFFGTGGTGLEVCSPGSGSNVSVGLPVGVNPGLRSPLHPSYLQMGQHYRPSLCWKHPLNTTIQLTTNRCKAH